MSNVNQYFNHKKIVVTGGYGFIGAALITRLLELGVREVVLIDHMRFGSQDRLREDERITFHHLDLSCVTQDTLETVIQGSDALFHLAAEKHNQSKHDLERVYSANIQGTYRLFHAAQVIGIRKIVFSSSLYVYGASGQTAFAETMIPSPHTLYGVSKRFGEECGQYLYQKFKMDFVALRYFFVYGPGQYHGTGYKSVIVKNFERLISGRPPIIRGDGNQRLDYIYIDDIVQNTLKAMSEPTVTNVCLNLGNEYALTINELTEKMILISGLDIAPFYEPKDETHETCRLSDCSLARDILGFTPMVTIDDGLRRTYNWIKHKK